MAPFDPPTTVLSGIKERPEALLLQGKFPECVASVTLLNRSTQTAGYMLEQQQAIFSSMITTNFPVRYSCIVPVLKRSFQYQENGSTLVDTKKALSRRPIDQLGYIPDNNSLAVLSGATTVNISV
jgi:hypothetical protein